MSTEWHPLGFRKYVLLSFRGYRIRLHIWPKGEGNDSPHNHRWWFLSVPLVGRFTEERFEEVTETGKMRKFDVSDKGGIRDGRREYVAKGPSSPIRVGNQIRYPLVPYFCRVGAIHSLTPYGKGFHASVVLTGRPVRRKSEMWQDRSHSNPVDQRPD